MNAYPIRFNPIPMERIWGGDQLKAWFNVQSSENIGEYWTLSSHPHGISKVINGNLSGKDLNYVTTHFPELYLGRSPQSRFPLLIKFLEVNDDLSIQVHPSDEYAKSHENDSGKTECWYILDSEVNTKIILGHTFTNPNQLFRAIETEDLIPYLQYECIHPDQTIYIPSGTIHALLKGTTLIEIQQTSDVTYRVHDWNRVDAQGNARELHIQKALKVIDFNTKKPTPRISEVRFHSQDIHHEQLLRCPYFTLEKITIRDDKYSVPLGNPGNPDTIIVTKGDGKLIFCGNEMQLTRGDTILIPSNIAQYLVVSGTDITILRAFY